MKSRFPELEGKSGQNHQLACPQCGRKLDLNALKDGDQAYWCHQCERGWRAGTLPPESRIKKNAA